MPIPNRILLIFLAVEFLDEFVDGAREAAWPLIRTDIGLTYIQIGLLLSVPAFVGNLVEPSLGVLGDVWKRRSLVLGGGLVFAASMGLVASSSTFFLLLAAFVLFYPASGAFVSLSQASLMDSAPTQRELNMARWTFAGSLGVVLGSLVLTLAVTTGFGWRGLFWALAVTTVVILLVARNVPIGGITETSEQRVAYGFLRGIVYALGKLRRTSVLRWLVLLEFSNLMLDVLHGYLALYFVDVGRLAASSAALGVATWIGFGVLGDFLLFPLLHRVRGLTYLRFSALAELLLFAAFLLVPGLWPKLGVVALLGLGHAGWYAILKAQLYSAMPGQSGTVMAVNSVSGLVGSLMPLGIGIAAGLWGLEIAMWLLIAGPIVLLIGIPPARSDGT
ncbi:MAG: MFS transporter [Chloroflexi bacterium]|nr:MFS transporter [Chloroflexota bacterium]